MILHHPAGDATTIHALQRSYTDGLNGQTVFTYHARLSGLASAATYPYTITADNDRHRAHPFSASLTTAAKGCIPFRWTSYGDLSTPCSPILMTRGEAP